MYRELLVYEKSGFFIVALVEENRLVSVRLESTFYSRTLGGIYKGTVKNVLPGMQAAFIDIGQNKNAYLSVDNIVQKSVSAKGDIVADKRKDKQKIEDLLVKGQEIMVQIIKEAEGDKGACLTTQPSLAGRYLVLTPTCRYIAVSKRLTDESVRERLKKTVESLLDREMGAIIRTVSVEASEDMLSAELSLLKDMWRGICARYEDSLSPQLVYQDSDPLVRTIRDIGYEDVNRIVVDSEAAYTRVYEVVKDTDSRLAEQIRIEVNQNLYKDYNLERQLSQALSKKVWLSDGGYIIIERTEALTAIDVNSGKYTGRRSLEDTVLHINMDAIGEIARQIRLRNIGGIIIIDFIDMARPEHRELIIETLKNEFAKDRVKTVVMGMTRLGLVEITRKKTSCELAAVMTEPCSCCRGHGVVIDYSKL